MTMAVTRTWSVPTSPRNPYKMCDELGLLKKYEGRVWGADTQREFAGELSNAEFYEGAVSAAHPDFSARDRINRSPKTFGFIRMDEERRIRFTPAGNQLITKQGLDDLFLRQLLKWQYPSPNHGGDDYKLFRIKPFLETLRLVRDLDGLSKKEIAIFCVAFTDFADYEAVKKSILDYRDAYQRVSGKRNRRAFELAAHEENFRRVYLEDLTSGQLSVRQGRGENHDPGIFLRKKMRNSVDYADAAMRYFRASGLFSLSARNFRLKIMDVRREIVDAVLEETPREPVDFQDGAGYLDFLGDNKSPALPDDDEHELRRIVSVSAARIQSVGGEIPDGIDEVTVRKMDFLALKQLRNILEERERNAAVHQQIEQLKTYQDFDDVIETFQKIQDRTDTDIPDKPLFFEWNVWRTMAMLDDGEIRANLQFDFEGKPFSGAPSKTADIICEYETFVLVVEVTLMSGHKQYDAEGEPVARHVGDIKKRLVAAGDKRPVLGLFIALRVSEATVAHFFAIRNINISHYGGKVIIIPMDLRDLENLLRKAKDRGGVKSIDLYALLSSTNEIASSVDDEQEWKRKISEMTSAWWPVMNG